MPCWKSCERRQQDEGRLRRPPFEDCCDYLVNCRFQTSDPCNTTKISGRRDESATTCRKRGCQVEECSQHDGTENAPLAVSAARASSPSRGCCVQLLVFGS